jgi:hypothetical protein
MAVTATYPQTGPHGGPGVLGPWTTAPRPARRRVRELAFDGCLAAAVILSHAIVALL